MASCRDGRRNGRGSRRLQPLDVVPEGQSDIPKIWEFEIQTWFEFDAPSKLLKVKSQNFLDLSRAEVFVRQLQAELAEFARCQAVTAAIIGELSVIR
jgi:hypothetical protein